MLEIKKVTCKQTGRVVLVNADDDDDNKNSQITAASVIVAAYGKIRITCVFISLKLVQKYSN